MLSKFIKQNSKFTMIPYFPLRKFSRYTYKNFMSKKCFIFYFPLENTKKKKTKKKFFWGVKNLIENFSNFNFF